MFSFDKSFIIQFILVVISLMGLVPYFLAYKIGSNRKKTDSFKLPINLYYISSYVSFLWYIMPILSQPRLIGITTFSKSSSTIFSVIYIVVCGIICAYFCIIWSGKTIKMNLTATKDTFYAPKKLLTDGIYSKVQHPMISGDMIAHFSFILFMGAFNTLILYPFYILYNWAIVKIQVKYSLEPYFREELKAYRKRTPAYLDKPLSLIVIVLIILLAFNFYFSVFYK